MLFRSKKYVEHEAELQRVLQQAEQERKHFTELVDKDTAAFNKVMEAYALPKENDAQKALRAAAIQEATKEATLIPLEVMRHVIDTLALTRIVAEKGNANSVSDAGVSALMLRSACDAAALNVQINLSGIADQEFVGWQTEELTSLLRTGESRSDEIIALVRNTMAK